MIKIEKGIQNIIQSVEDEYNIFMRKTLSESRQSIFDSAAKILFFNDAYNFVTDEDVYNNEHMSNTYIMGLDVLKGNILELMWEESLAYGHTDTSYGNLENDMIDTIRNYLHDMDKINEGMI